MAEKIKAGEEIRPPSKEELKALIEKYKVTNPEKYALKVASGEFDRKLGKK